MTPYEQQLWRRLEVLEKDVAELKARLPRVVHGVPYYWGQLDGEAYSERLVVLPERY